MNDQDAIQEKFYPPRFIQVPENMSIEEGRFCRMDFKVREKWRKINNGILSFEKCPPPLHSFLHSLTRDMYNR